MKNYILLVLLLLFSFEGFAQMSISLPMPGVYQSTGSTTSVTLAGQYTGTSLANYRIEYNVLRLNVSDGSVNSTYSGYSAIVTNPTYGLYRTSINLPIGWYQINVRVFNIATNTAGSSNSIKFGVGDVYVVAGQSNAQGVLDGSGSWSLPSLTTYDGILSHNVNGSCNAGLPAVPVMTSLTGFNRIAPSGNNSWNWAKTGQNLQVGSPAGGLPVAFFNAAAGGSTSVNWKQSASGINTTHDYTSNTFCVVGSPAYAGSPQPYFDFKNSLQFYGSIYGIKAVLWHQGEGDNNADKSRLTSQADYESNINYVIGQSRTDFSSNLRWLMSEVSYSGANPSGTITRSEIVTAQDNLTKGIYDGTSYSSTDKTYKGILTDGLGSAYREVTDGLVHFREDRTSALTSVGGLWSTQMTAPTNYANVAASTPPIVTMAKSGSNWTLTVSGTYSAYRWLNMSAPNTNSTSLGTAYYLSGSTGGAYACMVMSSNGKWAFSQTFYTGCGSCRIGAQELSEWQEDGVEKELGIEVKAYPIPTDKDLTLEFSIPEESAVRLELLDNGGVVFSKLADNVHAKGTYKYPVKVEKFREGVFFYRLSVNGLAITKKIIKFN